MFSLLLKHYNIEPAAENRWMRLSYHLALDTVPCFSYEKSPRGCPKKWTPEKKALLITAIEDYLTKHPNHSAMDACRHLAKKNTFQLTNEKSLYSRYMEAK